MVKKIQPKKAKIRVCASCETIFWYSHKSCPVCDFAHYGAVWALGWKSTFCHLIKQFLGLK